ncbi:unnamed protein product [Psylliodes chrysocephalus]|uniref:DUF659 domain-containing protein n=1 Tax=Psylliodes chrysocephalus TaxID=3402493 RepID=A0A9P0DBF3_9CUCU|nr:unnamed protein product [Psylliodes chrysocephala]
MNLFHTLATYCISRVINSFDSSIVVGGAVTDNTSANKVAWKILEETYPNKFFHGCVCHCLNLLVKDIFGDDTQSVNSPLGKLPVFVNECKNIVVFFKNHHALNHTLKEA